MVVRKTVCRSLCMGLFVVAIATPVVAEESALGGKHESASTVDYWHNNVEAAYSESLRTGKPLVVVFVCAHDSTGCEHCAKAMAQLHDPALQRYEQQAIFAISTMVRDELQASPDALAKRLGAALEIASYPTYSILLPNPNLIEESARIVGEFGFEELQTHLDRFLAKAQENLARGELSMPDDSLGEIAEKR